MQYPLWERSLWIWLLIDLWIPSTYTHMCSLKHIRTWCILCKVYRNLDLRNLSAIKYTHIREWTHSCILTHTHTHTCTQLTLQQWQHTHTPPHLTPASSEWLQSCTPTGSWPHSNKELSLPAHLSSSRRMDPEPLLNTPPRTGIAPATSNHSYCLLTINQYSLRSKHAMHWTFAQSPGECCYPTDLQLLKTSQSANSGYTTCLMPIHMTHPLGNTFHPAALNGEYYSLI